MDHKEEVNNPSGSGSAVIAANTREDLLYIFTNVGMWEIKTKTILASVSKINNFYGFDSAKVGGVDKVLHG